MKLSDFKQKTKKWNCFAAIDILGSFDFYTSIVSLDSLTSKDIGIAQIKLYEFLLKKANNTTVVLNPSSYQEIEKVFPLAAHEYTHFIDATSTIWGLRHLNLMKEAYEADDAMGGTEADFYKAKIFFDHIRTIRLPEYYTLRHGNSTNTKPWQYQFSSGRLFDSAGRPSQRTVVFTRFMNSNGDFLVRSPISIVSLLEMSAMAQELFINMFLLANTDDDFQAVEGTQYNAKLMDYLYNPDITEYSVCVHLVANILKLTDPATAFKVCNGLVGVILDMPTEYFLDLGHRCPIADIIKSPAHHRNVTYLRDGLYSRDYGTLFFLLCHALPAGDYTSIQSVTKHIETAINRVGADFQEMQSESELEAGELYAQLKNASMSEIARLAEAGFANFKKIEYIREKLPFEELNLPPVLSSDSKSVKVFPSTNNKLSTFNIESAFDNLYSFGQTWVERISEACL